MIAQTVRRTKAAGRRTAFVAAVLLAGFTAAAGCGRNDPLTPEDRLCDGEGGLGLQVEGRAQPVELCAGDADVSVLATSGDRYDIAAQIDAGGVVFQVRLVFSHRADFPVSLRVVDTLAEATADPDAVWIHFEEVPAGGDAIESATVSSGTFRLGFNDADVIAATLSNVTFSMRQVSNGDGAGTRTLAEGFFSLSVKDPAARVVTTRR
jgi:hypothetical protein